MTTDSAITYRAIYNRNRTICVWHDDTAEAEEIARVFREAGFVATTMGGLEDAVRSMQQHRADVLLVDIDKLLRDPQLIGILRVFSRGMRVFALTGENPPLNDIVQAVRAGALSAFARPYRFTDILREVTEALREDLREPASADQTGIKVSGFGSLTTRERQVLDEVVQGRTNKEVALEMGISPRTVEVHRAAVMKKLGARNTAQLVRIVTTR